MNPKPGGDLMSGMAALNIIASYLDSERKQWTFGMLTRCLILKHLLETSYVPVVGLTKWSVDVNSPLWRRLEYREVK